jgi:hypothetical protein
MNPATNAASVPESFDAGATKSPVDERWSALGLFAFRFVFAYLLLYNSTQTFEYVPVVGEDLYLWLDRGWRWLVPQVGKLAFGLDITIFPAGSGDTTFNYVQVALFAALALLAAAIWSALDRKRTNHAKLNAALRVGIRYVLAVTMMSYGMAKVVPTQFGPPGLERLTETYGESSPMGLLWTFMGQSTFYCVFIGLSETACGVLLWYRRTTLSGAILASIVMLNVFVLNMCFDVPVKLYSAHLELMALWLLLPDVRRLVSVACLHRSVPAVAIDPLFERRRVQRAWVALKTLLLAGYLAAQVATGLEFYGMRNGSTQSKLSGLYQIETFELDGVERAPLTTDETRWRSVVVSSMRWKDSYAVRIRTMDDKDHWTRGTIDEPASTLTLEGYAAAAAPKDVLTFALGAGDTWTITGTSNGKSLVAMATRKLAEDFLLSQRGFHWINEFPFNR